MQWGEGSLRPSSASQFEVKMNKMRSSLNREGSEVESEDKISILSDTHFTSSVSWAGEMAQPLEAMLTSKPNPMAQE